MSFHAHLRKAPTALVNCPKCGGLRLSLGGIHGEHWALVEGRYRLVDCTGTPVHIDSPLAAPREEVAPWST